MKTENATWITMDTDTRTDKRSVNDIFCMACRTKLGRVIDHQYIHLNGWDRQAVIDLIGGTVTVKCKCGVGRVIRKKGNFDEGNSYVWDDEEVVEGAGGESANDGQGDGKAN